MGQIKNIKLHIVTDIKLFDNTKCGVLCVQLRLKSVYISYFEQLTLSQCPKFQFPNLPVCTVHSFCTTMTSTSLARKWPRSSMLQKSTWRHSGLDCLPKLFKDATLEI